MSIGLTFSIIVNSYGRDKASVLSTLTQAKKSNPLEIILIDQNESPMDIKTPEAQYFHFPQKAISQARNFGASKARGQWMLFLDDDALLNDQSLAALSLFLSHREAQVVGGKIMVTENTSEYYSARQKISSGLLSFIHLKVIMGGLFAIKRETFNELKGFDPHFGIGGQFPSSEDTDLIWKAYFNHKKIGYCSDFFALHPRSSNISPEKAYLYGQGKGAMVAKWVKNEKKYLCLIEFLEMLIVPLLKGNFSSLKGRISGWCSYRT